MEIKRVKRSKEKEQKLWDKYIQPIVDRLSPMEKAHFRYTYTDTVDDEISQTDIIRLERRILVPMFNSLGFSDPRDFRSKVLAPLHEGKETMHFETGKVNLVQLFRELLTRLEKEGMTIPFLY
ncbi:MAG: hypothetical protein JRI51_05580 [Deltaproteobacteria bacterium]|nr:hypothetical protein [Deltaproteobacteria bacterium]